MFNHLVYHQKPHHGLRHSTAREIYQEWIKHHYTISSNPKNIDFEPKEQTNISLVTSQITSVKSSDTRSNNTETCDVKDANGMHKYSFQPILGAKLFLLYYLNDKTTESKTYSRYDTETSTK